MKLWLANVVMILLGNHKSKNYVERVQILVDTFKTADTNMIVKTTLPTQSFGSISRDLFPASMSDEQG